MKTRLRLLLASVLFFSAVAALRAGTLEDGAALFGSRSEEVRDALADLPVSMETRRTPPAEGLRAYADQRVNDEFERGFFVVITTEPHGWRISMNPTTLASPERVRLLGDRMAASFKRGQFVEGAKQLAASLHQLTQPAAAPAPTPLAPLTITPPPVPAARPVVHYPIPPGPTIDSWPFTGAFIFMAAMLLATGTYIFFQARSRLRHGTVPTNANAAKKIFDTYSPKQRERLARRNAHCATGDVLNDPFAFAMMMYMAQQSTISSIGQPMNNPTSSSLPSSFDSSMSSPPPSPSSSDSSGASGTW